MSAKQSNLSSARYGYDFVVATTQGSINATMKEYLSNLPEPEVVVCYVADSKGNPTPIDYAKLKQEAHGSDPFAVPANADPATNQDLKNLFAARFMVGFKARIGLPPGYTPDTIPDIIALGANTTSTSYNLMCSEFIVTQYTPGGGYSPATWLNVSQQPGQAWLFNSKVNLSLAQADLAKLPPAVAKQIKNLGGNAFSVQQLLFDLDSAALESIPTIAGVDTASDAYEVLQKDFLGKYFTQMKQNGSPILGCTVKHSAAPPATLTLTDLNFQTYALLGTNQQPIANPTPQQRDAATLDYLCAANGHPLPGPAQFSWNWMEPGDEANFDGVMSINRNALAKYFENQLTHYVSTNCYKPGASVKLDGLSRPKYHTDLTPGQTPTITRPPTGSTVLSYDYTPAEASDQAGLHGDIGQLALAPSYHLSVVFAGKTITITQHLVVHLRLKHLATQAQGNVVDKQIVDTYTLAVTDKGALTAIRASAPTDNSQNLSTNGFENFFTNLDSLAGQVASAIRAVTGTALTDIPLSVVQNFVFPGGKTFAFKDASFSDFQDLTAHITYADPS